MAPAGSVPMRTVHVAPTGYDAPEANVIVTPLLTVHGLPFAQLVGLVEVVEPSRSDHVNGVLEPVPPELIATVIRALA
jgi:hypothetical protein